MYLLETGDYEQGETAFVLPMTDELAAEYLAGRATDRGAVNLVETALEAVEVTAHTGVRRRNPGFSYPTSGPWLAKLLAECYIRTDRQEYVVKAVEKSSTSAWRKVSCALNIEELEGAPFEGFETVEQTVQAAAEFALEGTGWTVETDDDITKSARSAKRTTPRSGRS